MRTMPRLTKAYRNAKVVEIDSSSKIVIFSDSHRGDGSLTDEFRKDRDIFEAALQQYYDDGYTLIEAGDNDELWEYSKPHHIIKANPEVFDRLRQFHLDKRYIRIFGNHDMQLRDPEYVREHLYLRINNVTGRVEPLLDGLKVEEAVLLRHKNTGQEILTVHGHQGDFSNDQAWRTTMFTFRVFWRHLHALGIHSPSSPTRNSGQRHKVERNYVRWILKHGTALICGHTHRERFPIGDDAPYFNSGACIFPDYITGLEIVNDAISLVGWSVVPDANGYLHVAKKIMAGPRPLADFARRPDPVRHRRPEKSLDRWKIIAEASAHPSMG